MTIFDLGRTIPVMEIYTRHKTRHGLHLILTILTAGLWAPVWLVVAAWNRMGPRDKTVVRGHPWHSGHQHWTP